MSAGAVTVAGLVLAAEPSAWRAAGFEVDGDVARVGTIALRLAGRDAGRRIVRCELRGIGEGGFDGLPVESSDAPERPMAAVHPNGVAQVDHFVAASPDLDRTVAAIEAAGLDLRRLREGPTPGGSMRQAFFRLGETILEAIQIPPGAPGSEDSDGPARFYGLAFLVEDLDASVESLGELVGEPRDAVQPGRRIATIRREADLGLPVALITPGPGAV